MSDRDYIIQEIRNIFKEQTQNQAAPAQSAAAPKKATKAPAANAKAASTLPSGAKKYENEDYIKDKSLNVVVQFLLGDTPEGKDYLAHDPLGEKLLNFQLQGPKQDRNIPPGYKQILLQSSIDTNSVLVYNFKVTEDFFGFDDSNIPSTIRQKKVEWARNHPKTYKKHQALQAEKRKAFQVAYGHYIKAAQEREKLSKQKAAAEIKKAAAASEKKVDTTVKQQPVKRTPAVVKTQQAAAAAVKKGSPAVVATSPKNVKPVASPTTAKTAQGKTTSAKDAKPTKDFPFQVVQVGDNFPATIVPGMDRRDKGFGKKGASKSINSAAIKILGQDPRVIYTALINSGVIQPNYSPKADFSDLRGLIAKFQERAINGLLRYQKKMKISAKDAEKSLSYKPTVKTQDLRTKQDPELRDKMLADRPNVTTEQKAANVAVDGKIGSRTAKLLKVYAEKSSFEALKKKSGVVPKPEPVTKPVAKPEPKPEPKEEPKEDCEIGFRDEDDIRIQTVLVILGYDICQLVRLSNKYPHLKNKFSKLSDIFQTVQGGRGSTAFEQRHIKRKEKYVKAAGSKAGQAAVINQVVRPALQDKNKNIPAATPLSYYEFLKSFYEKAVSSKIVDFYGGKLYNPKSPKTALNFSFVKFKSGNVPLIYSSTGELSAFEGFLEALGYNSWITLPPGRRKDSFKKPLNLDAYKGNVLAHIKRIDTFLKEGISMAEKDASFRGSQVLKYAKDILYAYKRSAKVFLTGLQEFEKQPSEKSLDIVVSYGGPISIAQKMLNNA